MSGFVRLNLGRTLSLTPRKYFWLILFFLTLWRGLIAAQVGLGVDEAHYVLYGRYLDLSYFDHPPLVGWIHFIFQQIPLQIPLSADFVARLPAMTISVLTSWLALRFLLKRGFSEGASFFAVLLLNVTPLFNGLSLLLLPDSMLMPLSFLVIEAAERVSSEKSLQSWLYLGLVLGFAGLSKYTAILFVPGLVIYFLRLGRWRQLLTPGFFVGVIAALVVVSPIFIWNYRNHFVSFSYQSGHVLSFDRFSMQTFVQTWGSQWVLWGLGPAVIAVTSSLSLRTWRRSELLFLIALSFLGFFVFISFFQTVLPHWPLCFFVLMIPWAAASIWDSVKPSVKSSAKPWTWQLKLLLILPLLITLPLLLELGFRVFPSSVTAGIYHDVVQWKSVMAEAMQLSQSEAKGRSSTPAEQRPTGIAVFNWTLGSRAMYYAPPGALVFVLDGNNHQFSVWNPVSPKGHDLMIAIEVEKVDETLSQISCEGVQKVGHRKGYMQGALIHEFAFYQCLNYRGLKNEN